MSRTRLLMAGAVAGALLAIAISVFATTTSDDNGGTTPSEGSPELFKAPYDVPTGSCLTWQRPDGADMHEVKCDEPHLFEVTEIIDLSKDYARGAPQLSTKQWRTLAERKCHKGAEEYLHNKLDPVGKFKLSVLPPSEGDWFRGLRTVRCGLQRPGPGGGLQPLNDRAAELNQSDVWLKGTCLGIIDKTVGDPADCAKKHSYEIIAVVDLSDEFGKSYPSKRKQEAWLDTRCTKLAGGYTGGLKLEKKKLILTWDTRDKASWDAGSFLVNCKVGAILDDNSGLAAVTGSIAKPEKKPTPTTKRKGG